MSNSSGVDGWPTLLGIAFGCRPRRRASSGRLQVSRVEPAFRRRLTSSIYGLLPLVGLLCACSGPSSISLVAQVSRPLTPLIAICHQAADKLHFPVPCPLQVPVQLAHVSAVCSPPESMDCIVDIGPKQTPTFFISLYRSLSHTAFVHAIWEAGPIADEPAVPCLSSTSAGSIGGRYSARV